MKFAVTLAGKIVRLNDSRRTLLCFDSEIAAYKICRRLNTESKQKLRCKAYTVTRVENDQ